MSLSIRTNLAALSAHKNLFSNTGNLSKSVERLSSGLRINTAGDDPSGLAISQRFLTQIKGLEKAQRNAQDAVTYLQTAESSLDETQNVMQRMRELSIQAANGTLTASDRQELQKEIDQLKEEVNVIANSTEFNTKKILDGTGSALWSASSDDVSVVVNGRVREGNYELEIDAEAGENHVLKSDIFRMTEDAQGVQNIELNPAQAELERTLDGTTNANSGTLTFNFGTTADYDLAVDAGADAAEIASLINEDDDLSEYVIAISESTVSSNDTLIIRSRQPGEEGNSYSVTSDTVNCGGFASTPAIFLTGGEDYPSGVTSVSLPDGLPASMDRDNQYEIFVDNEVALNTAGDTAHVAGAYEQSVSSEITAASTAGALADHIVASASAVATANITAQSGSGYAILEVTQGGTVDGAGGDEILARVSFDNGKTWFNTGDLDTGAAVGITDGNSAFELSALTGGDTINTGDKLLVALNDRDFNNSSHAEIQIDSPFPNGAGDPQQTGPSWSYVSDSLNNESVSVEVGHLDTTSGNISFGDITIEIDQLASDGASLDVRDEDNTVLFDVSGSSGPAYGSTKLWQIDRFYDNEGNFILGESGKAVSIYNAEGDTTEIYIDPEDTIEGVADKIADAVGREKSLGGLGMGTGDSSIDQHIADFVTTTTSESDEAVRGTIIIRSPKMGNRGQLYFSAEENVLNALSLATVKEPENNIMNITVRDAHSGDLIGEEVVSDSTLKNVISGVDVKLNPNLDMDISWDSGIREFVFDSAAGSVTEMVHIVDNAQSFQIGAYKGQTMESFVGEMTTNALGINEVLVVDQALAQRSMTVLEDAIDKVSSERARIGALINRLGHTIDRISAQNETAVATRSNLMDVDFAKESTSFAKHQLLTQASQAMIAQANQLPQNLLSLIM